MFRDMGSCRRICNDCRGSGAATAAVCTLKISPETSPIYLIRKKLGKRVDLFF
jgi:hypothetical protein